MVKFASFMIYLIHFVILVVASSVTVTSASTDIKNEVKPTNHEETTKKIGQNLEQFSQKTTNVDAEALNSTTDPTGLRAKRQNVDMFSTATDGEGDENDFLDMGNISTLATQNFSQPKTTPSTMNMTTTTPATTIKATLTNAAVKTNATTVTSTAMKTTTTTSTTKPVTTIQSTTMTLPGTSSSLKPPITTNTTLSRSFVKNEAPTTQKIGSIHFPNK